MKVIWIDPRASSQENIHFHKSLAHTPYFICWHNISSHSVVKIRGLCLLEEVLRYLGEMFLACIQLRNILGHYYPGHNIGQSVELCMCTTYTWWWFSILSETISKCTFLCLIQTMYYFPPADISGMLHPPLNTFLNCFIFIWAILLSYLLLFRLWYSQTMEYSSTKPPTFPQVTGCLYEWYEVLWCQRQISWEKSPLITS